MIIKLIKNAVIISVSTAMGLFLSGNGFAMEQTISDHPHFFPYTKVLADEYHLRLDVDHPDGKMYLIFEDISEKAVRIMPLKNVAGEVLLPGGKTMVVEFKAVKQGKSTRTRRDPLIFSLKKRKAGRFVVTEIGSRQRLISILLCHSPSREKTTSLFSITTPEITCFPIT